MQRDTKEMRLKSLVSVISYPVLDSQFTLLSTAP